MDEKSYLQFLHTIEKLKCNLRHSWTSNGRQESIAEHSWRLASMAYLFQGEFPNLNMQKVIAMCLFHDIGEAVTGDIPVFDKTSQDSIRENAAVDQLLEMLPLQSRQQLSDLFLEMKAGVTEEAKLWCALDKLEAAIQHNEADLSSWIPLEYELNPIYGEAECRAFPFLKELKQLVKQESIHKINRESKNITE